MESDYARRLTRRDGITCIPKSEEANQFIILVLRAWLDGFTDMLDLLFRLGKRPKYRTGDDHRLRHSGRSSASTGSRTPEIL